jgi:hypothetical protein
MTRQHLVVFCQNVELICDSWNEDSSERLTGLI